MAVQKSLLFKNKKTVTYISVCTVNYKSGDCVYSQSLCSRRSVFIQIY